MTVFRNPAHRKETKLIYRQKALDKVQKNQNTDEKWKRFGADLAAA